MRIFKENDMIEDEENCSDETKLLATISRLLNSDTDDYLKEGMVRMLLSHIGAPTEDAVPPVEEISDHGVGPVE